MLGTIFCGGVGPFWRAIPRGGSVGGGGGDAGTRVPGAPILADQVSPAVQICASDREETTPTLSQQ
jgi:hypothetical protein